MREGLSLGRIADNPVSGILVRNNRHSANGPRNGLESVRFCDWHSSYLPNEGFKGERNGRTQSMCMWRLLTTMRLLKHQANWGSVLLRPHLYLQRLYVSFQLRVSKRLAIGYCVLMNGNNRQTSVERALREYQTELKRFVASRAPYSDVDDILQIAAMHSVEKADSLKDCRRVLPWLFQIHRHAAIDYVRRTESEQRKLAELEVEPAPEESKAASMCGCSIEQASQLNARYSTILDMVDLRGASLKEAARKLGVTANTATVRLHRARKALKQRLLNHCGVSTMRECVDCRCTSDGCCPT